MPRFTNSKMRLLVAVFGLLIGLCGCSKETSETSDKAASNPQAAMQAAQAGAARNQQQAEEAAKARQSQPK